MNVRKETDWKIITEDGITENEQVIAENEQVIAENEQVIADTFNTFVISKIKDLKNGIDRKFVEDPPQNTTINLWDPLSKLKKNLNPNGPKFDIIGKHWRTRGV